MVLLIYLNAQLHISMYFLLRQLSLMDLMLICTTVPKMAVNFLAIFIASYNYVILAVIHMGSGEGHCKAFATSSSHLMVVECMYYGTVMFMYIWPASDQSPTQYKIVSIFYTTLTLMLNPLIYSLYNREVNRPFMKVLRWSKP
ncbi:Olfactory receptor 2M2 [Heterocephalus glaber]|uniref:Olfactory receptor 2M2 n=1 Tax=Heterocephalus glaber TaxID=10181 RepID=G5APC3_HETGA|nr:Olfactory receptor 2M2 [Heterocephalus glaber]